MPLVKRKMHITCKEEECFKLYELLKERIPPLCYVSFEVIDKGLVIEAYGYETDVKALWFEIRKLLTLLREAMSKSKQSKKYSVDLIVRTTRKTFPPAVLVEVLKRRGYNAEFVSEENSILSNAPFEEVVEIASKIADLNFQVGKLVRGTSIRYYIVSLSILTGLSVEEAIKLSLERGVLEESSGVFTLKTDWREALDKVLKTLKLSE